MERSVEVFHAGLDFGEGPRWHDDRLWVSDFFAHRVSSYDAGGASRVELELDDQPSGLGWLPSGDLLVVAMTSRQVRRVDGSGVVHLHADLSGITSGPCNDMVVDGRGNAYVGEFGFEMGTPGARPAPGNLALVRPDGSVEVAASGLRFPNGSVITPDGGTLVVGESMGSRYTAFRIADDGTLADQRVWAQLERKGPDGCVLDVEGAIWMADASGGGCFRVAEGGEILDHVTASQPVFACTLGGPERRTLYLITAPAFGEKECAGLGLGRIEVTEVDVPGAGWP
jgi:sugar lactone lactonase YvrE